MPHLGIQRAPTQNVKPQGVTTEDGACPTCCGRDFWTSRWVDAGITIVCRRCHPPVEGAEAAPLLEGGDRP